MTPKAKTWLKWGLVGVGAALAFRVMFESGSATLGPIGKAANFSGKDVRGNHWAMTDYRGRQPMIVDFFATWCGPCQQEWPELEELARKHKEQGLVVVAVTDENVQDVNAYPKYRNSPITVLPEGRPAGTAYGIQSIPRTFFFNAKGDLVDDVQGYDPEHFREAVKKLGL